MGPGINRPIYPWALEYPTTTGGTHNHLPYNPTTLFLTPINLIGYLSPIEHHMYVCYWCPALTQFYTPVHISSVLVIQ